VKVPTPVLHGSAENERHVEKNGKHRLSAVKVAVEGGDCCLGFVQNFTPNLIG